MIERAVNSFILNLFDKDEKYKSGDSKSVFKMRAFKTDKPLNIFKYSE
jgi:hypothetical protein